jgi:hypothetical protein
MSRRTAYLITGRWPIDELSSMGLATSCVLGGGQLHVGLFFPHCMANEVAQHSDVDISEPDARGNSMVCFDYQLDLLPRFQAHKNNTYWTESATVHLYPLVGTGFEALHAACVAVAKLKPLNSNWLRINPLLGGWLPCTFGRSGHDVGSSTCVALSMRIIAFAKTGQKSMLKNDQRVIDALQLPTGSCQPVRLVGYTPDRCVSALRASNVIGPRQDDVYHSTNIPLLALSINR